MTGFLQTIGVVLFVLLAGLYAGLVILVYAATFFLADMDGESNNDEQTIIFDETDN